MTPGVKPLVAGNWKMNGLRASLGVLEEMAAGYNSVMQARLDMLVCLPHTLLALAAESGSEAVKIGGQDCHTGESGAHTGDISAAMIRDTGATAVIVGHSERRTDHGESSQTVKQKAEAGLEAGLMTIVCIGETQGEREAGETLAVLENQLSGSMPDDPKADSVVVAYEPVWAIGTGLVPSSDDVADAHKFMRDWLTNRFGNEGEAMRLLYGGSVKPSNAGELVAVPNVDGALVGGASLKAEDFLGICAAYNNLT
ncbi:MAG: triose-phosphate isomerase [Pseudomonadota bacterium]